MKNELKKAYEIKDAKISFVSLVDKAANKRQFLITKADDGTVSWKTVSKLFKSADHYVTGVVYEPLVEDSQGDFMTADEIQKAAYWFAKNGDAVDIQHNFEAHNGISVVENWVAKADFEIDGEKITKGTWLITAEIKDDDIWEKIQKGEITGFSMGGSGVYDDEDVDLDTLKKNDNRGILAKIASVLGFKTVVKGDVAEIFGKRTKRDMFWNAFNALEECLYRYDWNIDEYVYEDDESKIRECLTDFSEIMTNLLSGGTLIAKEIAPDFDSLKKSDSESAESPKTICGAYDSLGDFLKQFKKSNDKEEIEVKKDELEKIVQDSIAKALAAKNETPEPKAEEQVTKEFVIETVNKAVQKALEPKTDGDSSEKNLEKMIEEAVEKAVEKALEPIRKQTGLPSHIDSEENQNVEKQDEHYLHGFL